MEDEITDVQPSEVEFIETLKEGHNSAIFKVKLRGITCVMKVYHGRRLSDACNPLLEYDLCVRESSAYRRLKANGLCDRGIIPDFYGSVTKIDPRLWPDLYMFHNDELPANAIFIEYVPNMHEIDLSNFSRERMAKLREILLEFHKMGVTHGDTYPRNMMIAPGSPGKEDRVLWVDFDSAQTLQLENLSEINRDWIHEEIEMMDYFSEGLAKDFEGGQLNIIVEL
ncbi:hypothetical protein MY11210_003274 [Beauveria gryllotalpidicola]